MRSCANDRTQQARRVFQSIYAIQTSMVAKVFLANGIQASETNELPSEQLEAVKQDGFDADYTSLIRGNRAKLGVHRPTTFSSN